MKLFSIDDTERSMSGVPAGRVRDEDLLPFMMAGMIFSSPGTEWADSAGRISSGVASGGMAAAG